MAKHDLQYLDLLDVIMAVGNNKGDRTGTGTKSIFGHQMRFDLSDGTIPMLTTKKMFVRGIIHEILWYLQGNTNIKYLTDNNVHIWDEWADQNGNLGPVYGKQWRNWGGGKDGGIDRNYETGIVTYVSNPGIDQLAQVIETLKTNPNDRRMIVSSWNVEDLPNMNLPPCHCLFQFYVADGKLSCQLYQRSCDVFLGVPFNIVQYSILLRMIALVTNLDPGEFIWTGGDVHIYNNHFDQAKEQLSRTPYDSPKLWIDPTVQGRTIDNFEYDDFEIHDYQSHPTIKAAVSV